ncbi:hypothetical protein [Lutibacter sp. B1]|uniref:hypothetical protein n=1 Tax=Lutibacter sp. B1 TaxID=2725996 RepID=UPI00145634DD|nr:hypothetical protein [Lutibacter sp. B1]NLP57309.1 hypothetical protein [Lutibacter sp. B1]
MRKFKLLALALVFGVFGMYASNAIGEPNAPTKEIRNEIIKLLKTPDFVVEKDMTVILKFTFSSEGEIVVLCPGCEDKEIVKYIRKNLNYKKFKNPGERDKIYTIPLTLKAA